MIDTFRRLAQPLHRRIMLMVGRGAVRTVNDAAGLQELQVSLLADETRDRVERFQEYGFTSHPHPGAEEVAVCVAGSRDHAIVIAVDDRRYRLRGLAAGEAALYDDLGQVVHLKRDGIVAQSPTKITATAPEVQVVAEVKVTMVTPLVAISGNLEVDGNITAGGEIADAGGAKTMSGMRQVFDGHGHPHPADGQPIPAPNQQM